jgi:hypothetical protein
MTCHFSPHHFNLRLHNIHVIILNIKLLSATYDCPKWLKIISLNMSYSSILFILKPYKFAYDSIFVPFHWKPSEFWIVEKPWFFLVKITLQLRFVRFWVKMLHIIKKWFEIMYSYGSWKMTSFLNQYFRPGWQKTMVFVDFERYPITYCFLHSL